MNIELLYRPGSAAARVTLTPGEHVTSEGGAMIAMSGDMNVSTTTHSKGAGNVMQGLGRMLSGENLFLNHFTAGNQGGEVLLATPLPGDMMTYELDRETLVVQAGSYVASENGVDIGFGWQGFRSLFSGENAFWLHLKGKGKVVFNAFGAIYPLQVTPGNDQIVDTGHIVAFQETLSFQISKAGKSWISSFLGGEGLVCRFSGTGTVWCQSHNPKGFGTALGPKLKPR